MLKQCGLVNSFEFKKMNTSELLVQCLENEGVRYVLVCSRRKKFARPRSPKKSSIQFITTRHEQGAAFMNVCGV